MFHQGCYVNKWLDHIVYNTDNDLPIILHFWGGDGAGVQCVHPGKDQDNCALPKTKHGNGAIMV